MRIKEADLPGVGRKYTLDIAEGATLSIIIHHSGKREIYLMEDPDEDEPAVIISLNDEEARKIGAIIAGSDYQPITDERMELLVNNLYVEWLKVDPESPLANRTIRDSDVKDTFGVTIIGIQRGKDIIGSPTAEQMILPGDLLMVVGRRDQIRLLDDLCSQDGLCRIPGGWQP
jgi:TrkA domain protein